MKDADAPRHRFDPSEFEDGCCEEVLRAWLPVGWAIMVFLVGVVAVGAWALYAAGVF